MAFDMNTGRIDTLTSPETRSGDTSTTSDPAKLTSHLAVVLEFLQKNPEQLDELQRAIDAKATREDWQGSKEFCINGHRLTKKSVGVTVYGKYVQRRCKVCASERDRLRYHNNPARREKVLARARAVAEQRKK